MLSRPLTFLLYGLAMLLAVIFSFSWEAVAQSEDAQLIRLPVVRFTSNAFVVYGRAPTQAEAGIVDTVLYRQTTETLPDLEEFFELGATLELVTTTFSVNKHDIVISEIMWGIDSGHPVFEKETYTQWIELYNTHSSQHIRAQLFLLFSPLRNYPDRDMVELPNGKRARVLDAISTLHLGTWDLPGESGRRPNRDIVSAYRNITYSDSENADRVPFGSYEDSWIATPKGGRRNTLLRTFGPQGENLPYIATPGSQHVPDPFSVSTPILKNEVPSDTVVINEVRNDVSGDNLDWIELKNISYSIVQLKNWELSIVTGVGEDIDLVDFPDYEMLPEEILLLQANHPKFTDFADGINIESPEGPAKGAIHKYLIVPNLHLPDTGPFLLLLRSQSDKNGQDEAIEDYAGNGFFPDPSSEFNTEFWPRRGHHYPTNVAAFGHNTFASHDTAWARIQYYEDEGHHKDAWEEVGTQGGIGYAPGADRSIAPGTPGYENRALKTQVDGGSFRTLSTDREYDDGEITISEIMFDAGPRRNMALWIEFYNSSLTQAVNLQGWELEIRNLEDEEGSYVDGSFIFNEAIILPNQTLLLVSKNALNNMIDNRIYDLSRQHRQVLNLSNRRRLLSPTGFYLRLSYKSKPVRGDNAVIVDEAGNLEIIGNVQEKVWDLPERDPELRQSLVRQYEELFRPNQDERDRYPDFAETGTYEEAWRQADRNYLGDTYYGDNDDRGTPGFRLGGPLPVQLSNFRPERTATGAVLISWTTESELNNAGFNILRSERQDEAFGIINATLIPGADTSSEKHHYSFTDTTAKPKVVYYYRIEDVSLAGAKRTLVTVRLKRNISPTDNFITSWSRLKVQD